MEIDDSIDHKELFRLLDKDKIKNIEIQSSTFIHGQKQLLGRIQLEEEVKWVTIGNVDHLLERLEEAQLEKGRSHAHFIDIKYVHGITHDRLGHYF